MRTSDWGPRWVLLVLLLTAVLLRLPGVFLFPFEQDELYTIYDATHLFSSSVGQGISARPLYYVLQYPLLLILPATEITIRLLPLLIGLLGVFVTWVLAVRMLGWWGGMAAAVLLLVSPWHIFISTFGRYWSLVYLLAATFYLLLLEAYRSDRRGRYLGALTIGLLGSATHPTFLFSAVGVGIGITAVRADGSLGFRWPTKNAVAFLWLPWLLCLVVGYILLQTTGNSDALRNFEGRGAAATLRLVPAVIQTLNPSIVIASAFGIVLLMLRWRQGKLRQLGAVALAGICSTAVLMVLASTKTDVYADYAAPMLPLVFVTAAVPVSVLATECGALGRASSIGLLLILVGAVTPSVASHLVDGTRFDYRPLYDYVRGSDPDSPVFTRPIVLAKHYAPELDSRELTAVSPGILQEALIEHDQIWVVLSIREYGTVGDIDGSGSAWVADHCHRATTSTRMRFDSRQYRTELWRCEELQR